MRQFGPGARERVKSCEAPSHWFSFPCFRPARPKSPPPKRPVAELLRRVPARGLAAPVAPKRPRGAEAAADRWLRAVRCRRAGQAAGAREKLGARARAEARAAAEALA